MTKLNAGIIIIGDEILSGRTKDTNSKFIADHLGNVGIDLDEIRVIHDCKEKIIENILIFHNKYSYVFTTGGIGPTHDDITSESIAYAFNRKFLINKEAYKILEEYYPKGEFTKRRQRMSMTPENVKLILNPLTAAPGFIIENVYVLPGVPEIMQIMFKNVLNTIKKGKPKKTITINTNLYESVIAENLTKLQKKYKECLIGSYPYFNFSRKTGGVNIVLSSWTMNSLDEISVEIKEMIKLLGGKSDIV